MAAVTAQSPTANIMILKMPERQFDDASDSSSVLSSDRSETSHARGWQVVVNRTFINIIEDHVVAGVTRRCNSSPPSPSRKRSQLESTWDSSTQASDDEQDGMTKDLMEATSSMATDEFASAVPSAQGYNSGCDWQVISSKPEICSNCSPVVSTDELRTPFLNVLIVVQDALRSQGWFADLILPETDEDCRFGLCIHVKFAHQQAVALVHAKMALASATETSESVYMLSYEREPFLSSAPSDCFTTRFANVEDPENACWDLLRFGRCHRKLQCRWQHPAVYQDVTVTADVRSR